MGKKLLWSTSKWKSMSKYVLGAAVWDSRVIYSTYPERSLKYIVIFTKMPLLIDSAYLFLSPLSYSLYDLRD